MYSWSNLAKLTLKKTTYFFIFHKELKGMLVKTIFIDIFFSIFVNDFPLFENYRFF